MLELAERLVESEVSGKAERTKHQRKWIERAMATKVTERENSQCAPPSATVRPIEDDCTLAQARQDVRLDVIVPNRTVGIDKEHVTATRAPPAPDGQVKKYASEEV